MKKVIRIVVAVIILIFILIFLGYTQISRIVSHVLTEKAGVDVSIDRIYLSPNEVGLYGVEVGNFPNSILHKSLEVKKTKIDANWKEYSKDKIVIDEIAIDDLYIGLEYPGTSYRNSNLDRIGDNLSNSNAKDAQSGKKDHSKEVLIKVLELRNVHIQIAMNGDKSNIKTLQPIKHVRFTNVSSKGGIPSAQIMNLIIQQALRDFLSPQNLQNLIKQPGNVLKGLFSEAEVEN